MSSGEGNYELQTLEGKTNSTTARNPQPPGTAEQRGNCGRRGLYQCGALSYKNVLLLLRNWKSSLLIILAPAIVVIILGAVASMEAAAANAGQAAPVVFASLDNTVTTQGFPKCRVFDTNGGMYGYGKAFPNAKCTSLMFAPSSNAETLAIVQKLIDNSPSLTTMATGLTSAATVDTVIQQDVVGMATVRDLELWISNNANLGWVSTTVAFNTTTKDGTTDYSLLNNNAQLPPKVRYTMRYNATAVGDWYGGANLDATFKAVGMSSFVLRAQRSLEEAIVAVRSGHSATTKSWLNLQLQRFPQFPFISRFSSGYSIIDFTSLFFYIASSITFMLAVVTIVDEKERGLLGSMRTVGLIEIIYWLSWLLYYFCLSTVSTLLLLIVGACFGQTLPFFSGTDVSLQFHLFFIFQMSMVMFAFLFAALLPRFVPAVSVAGGLFFLGLIAQLVMALGKGMLNTLLLDPLLGAKAAMFYPPIAFATVLSEIVRATTPVWKTTDGVTTKLYPTFTYNQFIGLGGKDAVGNEYMAKNLTSLFCPSGTDPQECVYNYTPLSEVFDYMIPTAFICLALAWYLGQMFTGGYGRARWFWYIFDPAYWCVLPKSSPLRCCPKCIGKPKTTAIDPTDGDVQAEYGRCRANNASGSQEDAVCVSNLYKTFGTFNAVDGLCVSMNHNEIFALLGHNGAGKTTAIRMMTALTSSNGGTMNVGGYDVATETSKVRENIGVCPQHDVLWSQLTSLEHLKIFSMLKGYVATVGLVCFVLNTCVFNSNFPSFFVFFLCFFFYGLLLLFITGTVPSVNCLGNQPKKMKSKTY
jgi:hypothetical protein